MHNGIPGELILLFLPFRASDEMVAALQMIKTPRFWQMSNHLFPWRIWLLRA